MTTRSSLRRRLIASTALVGGAIAVPAMAQTALPDVAGITTIMTQGLTAGAGTPVGAFDPVFTPGGTVTAPTLGIALNDNRTIINYGGDGFNIGSAATVNFTDTRAGIVEATGASANIAVLNRDISGTGSLIDGTLTASSNIAVYVLNTQGITFGTGANVNVGALIASSLDLDASQDTAFLNAEAALRFSGALTQTSGVTVLGGSLRTTAGATDLGQLVLLGAYVDAQGGTQAARSDVAFVAATDVTMTTAVGSPLAFTIDAGTAIDSVVRATGTVRSAGTVTGQNVTLAFATQDAITDALLSVTGTVTATTATATDRGVLLAAGYDLSGTLSIGATETNGGGSVEVSGALTQDGVRPLAALEGIGIFAQDNILTTEVITANTGRAFIVARDGDVDVANLVTRGINATVIASQGAGATRVGTVDSTNDVSIGDVGLATPVSILGTVFLGDTARLRIEGSSVAFGPAATVTAGLDVRVTANAGGISATGPVAITADSDGSGGESLILRAIGGPIDLGTSSTLTGGADLVGTANDFASDVAIYESETTGLLRLGRVSARGLFATDITGVPRTGFTRTGAVTFGNLTLTQGLSVTTTAAITTGNILVSGAAQGVTLDAGAALQTGAIGATATIDLDGTTVTTGALTGVDVSVDATGAMMLASVASTGAVSLTGTGTTDVAGAVTTTTPGTSVTIDRDGTVELGSIAAAGDILIGTVTPAASLTIATTMTGGGVLTVRTSGDQSYGGPVEVAGPIDIATTGAGILDFDAGVRSTGSSLLLVGLGAVTIDGLARAATDATITGPSLMLAAVTATAGAIDLTANAGALSATDLNAGASIDATATGTAAVRGNVVATTGYFVEGSAVTLGDVDADLETQTAAGAVRIRSTNGAVTGLAGLTLTANSDNAGAETLILDATGGGIDFGAASLVGSGNRSSNIGIRLATEASPLVLGTVSARGLYSADAGGVLATVLTTTGPITLGTTTVRNALSVTTTNTITTGAISVTGTGQGLSLTAMGATSDIVATTGLIQSQGDLVLDAGRDVAIATARSNAGNASVTAGRNTSGTLLQAAGSASEMAGTGAGILSLVGGVAGIAGDADGDPGAIGGGATPPPSVPPVATDVTIMGATVDKGIVTATGALNITATTGQLSLVSGTAGTTATLTKQSGTGDLRATTLTSGTVTNGGATINGSTTITSATDARLGTVRSQTGSVTVTAVGDVTGVVATTGANLRADGFTTPAFDGTVDVDAGGLARLGTLTARNAVDIEAVGIAEVRGDVTAGTTYYVTGSAVTLGDLDVGDELQSAGGIARIRSTAGAITGLAELILTANSDATGIGAEPLLLDATGGNIDFTGATLRGGTPTGAGNRSSKIGIRLGTPGSTLTLGTVAARGLYSVDAGGTLFTPLTTDTTITLGSVNVRNALSVATTGGDIATGAITVTGTGQGLTLDASQAIVATGTLSSQGNMSLTAGTGITVTTAVSNFGSLTATTTAGTITGSQLRARGSVSVSTPGDLLISIAAGAAPPLELADADLDPAAEPGDPTPPADAPSDPTMGDLILNVGGVDVVSLSAGRDLSVTTTGNLRLSTGTAGRNLTLLSGAAITGRTGATPAGGIDAAFGRTDLSAMSGFVDARAATLAQFGTVTSGTSLFASTQTGGLELFSATAGTTATLTKLGVTSDLIVTSLTADTLASLTSATNARLGNVASTTGSVLVTTTGAVTGLARAPLEPATDGRPDPAFDRANLSANATPAAIAANDPAGDINVNAGTLVQLGNLSASDAIVVMPTPIAEVAGNVVAGGDYTVTSGSVRLGGAGTATQSANGAVRIVATAGAITGVSGLTLTANANATGTETLVLDATGGGIDFGAASLVGAPDRSSNIGIRLAPDSAPLTLGTVSARGLYSADAFGVLATGLTTTGPVTLGTTTLRNALSVTTNATIATGAIAVTGVGQGLSLTAVGAASTIVATTGTIQSQGDLTLLAGGDIAIATARSNAGNASVTSTGGSTTGTLLQAAGTANEAASFSAGIDEVRSGVPGMAGDVGGDPGNPGGGATPPPSTPPTATNVNISGASVTKTNVSATGSLTILATTGQLRLGTGSAGTTAGLFKQGVAGELISGTLTAGQTATVNSTTNARLGSVSSTTESVLVVTTGALTGLALAPLATDGRPAPAFDRANLAADGAMGDVTVNAGTLAQLDTVTAGRAVDLTAAGGDLELANGTSGTTAALRTTGMAGDVKVLGLLTGGTGATITSAANARLNTVVSTTGSVSVTTAAALTGLARAPLADATDGRSAPAFERATLTAASATGDVIVTAGTLAQIDTATAGRALSLTTLGGDLDLNTGTAGTTASAVSGGSGDVKVNTSLTGTTSTIVDAARDARLALVTTNAGPLMIDATGAVSGIAIAVAATDGRPAPLFGRAVLSALGATGDVTVTAGTLAQIDTGTAARALAVTVANGDLDIVTGTGGSTATLTTTTGGDVKVLGSLTGNGLTSVDAAGNARLAEVISQAGAISIVADQAVTGLTRAPLTDATDGRSAPGFERAILTAASPTGDVSVTAGTLAQLGTVTAGRALALTTLGGDLDLLVATAGTTASLTTGGTGDVKVGGSLTGTTATTIDAAGDARLALVTTTVGPLAITTGGEVTGLAIDPAATDGRPSPSFGRAILTAQGATGDLTVDAGTLAQIETATAGGALSLTTTGGDLELVDGTAGTTATLRTNGMTGDVKLFGTLGGNTGVTIQSAANARLNNVVSTTGSIQIAAAGDLSGLAGTGAPGDVLPDPAFGRGTLSAGDAVGVIVGGSVQLGSVTATNAATVDAGGDVDILATLAGGAIGVTAGGAATLDLVRSSGSSISVDAASADIGEADAATSLSVITAGTLQLGTGTSGTTASLFTSGPAGDIIVGTLDGGTTTSLIAGGNIRLGDVTSGNGLLSVNATGDVTGLALVEPFTPTSGPAPAFGRGTLTAAGAAGDATVMAGGLIQLDTVGAARDVTLKSGAGTDVLTTTAARAARVTAGTLATLGTVTGTAATVDVTAATATIGTATAGTALTATATGGDLTLTTGTAGGTATLATTVPGAGDVIVTTLNAGGAVAITSVSDARLGDIMTTAGAIDVTASSGEVTGIGDAGANLTGAAAIDVTGGSLARLATALAATSLSVTADAITATTATATAGALSLAADAGGITLGTGTAGTSATLDARDAVQVTTAITANGGALQVIGGSVDIVRATGTQSLDVRARSGALRLETGSAGTTALLDKLGTDGELTAVTLNAGGATTIGSSTSARLGDIATTAGAIDVTASGGEVTGIGTNGANLAGPATITVTGGTLARLGTATAGTSLTVTADTIEATTATATAGALSLVADAGGITLGTGTADTTATLDGRDLVAVTTALTANGGLLSVVGGSVDILRATGAQAIDLRARSGLLNLVTGAAGGTALLSKLGTAGELSTTTLSARGVTTITSSTSARLGDVVTTAGALSVVASGGEITGLGSGAANLRGPATLLVTGGTLARLGTVDGGTSTDITADTIAVTSARAGTAALTIVADAGAVAVGTASAGTSARLDASGATTLGSGTAGTSFEVNAGTLATIGNLGENSVPGIAAAAVTIRANDAQVNDSIAAPTVVVINRSATPLRLGNFGTGDTPALTGAAFTLVSDEVNRIATPSLTFDNGLRDVAIGNLTLGDTIGATRVEIFTAARIDLTGALMATGPAVGGTAVRTFQLGGTARNIGVSSAIAAVATAGAGGRVLLDGNTTVELRGVRIAFGQTAGFLSGLGLGGTTPTAQQVATQFISNPNSSLYSATAPTVTGMGVAYTAPTLLRANTLAVTFGDFALFQNTGQSGTGTQTAGVVVNSLRTPTLAFAATGPNAGVAANNGFALFGSINDRTGNAAALLGAATVALTAVNPTNARINGCLVGSGGGGCLITTISPPQISLFDQSQLNIFKTVDDLAIAFDPVVGTNNEALFSDLGTVDFQVDDLPICEGDDDTACVKDGAIKP